MTFIAKIFRYELPLMKRLTTRGEEKGATSSFRTGLVLYLQNEEGMAHSEISPLAGLHQETTDAAFEQLCGAIPQIPLCPPFSKGEFLRELFPSVRFGIEMAMMQLTAQRQGLSLHRFLNPGAHNTIRLRALIDPTEGDVAKAAACCVAQGFQTIKLKVGRLPLTEELRLIKDVRHAVGRQTEICLDANRAFDLPHAIELGHACAKFNVFCIEEPLKNPSEIGAFYRATGIPVALDETLLEAQDLGDCLDGFGDAVSTLVVKPALLGSVTGFLDVVAMAQQRKMQVVVTSAFESGIGLSQLSQLAALGHSQAAHGLATYSWFKEDLLAPPFRPFRGEVDVEQVAKNLARVAIEKSANCKLVWMHER